MKVLYASTWLATGGINGVLGGQWNGHQVNEEADFFRAAAVTFFARGNRATTFSFSVFQSFNTEGEAMQFAATQINNLSQQADLVVWSEDSVYSVVLAQAVLVSVTPGRVVGCSCEITYSFAGGAFAIGASPPTPITYLVQAGKIALATNDESKAVTFPLAFATTPVSVEAWVLPASGSPIKFIAAAVLGDTINTTGFTASIGYPIPDNSYFLMWQATGT